jgi:hypothetical protein
VQASPAAVWEALLATFPGTRPSWAARIAARVWGADPAESNGLASHVIGAERPGLVVCEVVTSTTLAARGRHRFAVYQIVFSVAPQSASSSVLTVETFAAFPGTLGQLYRRLVVDLGPHAVVMRLALRYLRRRAEAQRSQGTGPRD